MRRPLFKEFSEPLAVLVKAVESVQPEIRADDVPADLVLLAQNCLVKHPEARLALVSWNDFDMPSGTRRSAESVKERVKKRALLGRTQVSGEPSTPRLTARQISDRIAEHLESIIRLECVGGNSFPPIQLMKNMDGQIQVRVIFAASPSHALPQPLSIRFDCELVDEATMALRIAASACLLPDGAPHGNSPAPANVFRGPLDSNTLPARIQDVLWCAIDLAQRQAVPRTLGGDPCWVNLVQELEGQP